MHSSELCLLFDLCRWAVFGIATGGFWALVLFTCLLRKCLLSAGRYRTWRLARAVLLAALVAFAVSLAGCNRVLCTATGNWLAGGPLVGRA